MASSAASGGRHDAAKRMLAQIMLAESRDALKATEVILSLAGRLRKHAKAHKVLYRDLEDAECIAEVRPWSAQASTLPQGRVLQFRLILHGRAPGLGTCVPASPR